MRIPIFLLIAACSLSSCTHQLYSWANYESASYNYLKNSDERSTQALIESLKNVTEIQTGTRKISPPGIYADYGYLLIQLGKTDQGKTLLLKEIELYPESKIFIERILKMIEQ
jgi:hypothetical protein